MYESTNNNDTPTNQSGMGMMSPSQQTREAWEESADMSYSSELQEVSCDVELYVALLSHRETDTNTWAESQTCVLNICGQADNMLP